MTRAKASKAQAEGYKLVGDSELRQIVDGRARQLEQELAGHRMLLDEHVADPHVDDDADNEQNPIASTRRAIESLEARLEVLAQRRAALGNDAEADSSGE